MRTEPSFSAEPEQRLLPDTADRGKASSLRGDAEEQLLLDYRQRYGLSVDPFADDPHFPFYTGAQRRHVLEQLLHLCQFSQNLLVVAGEFGVGKTRMAQALIDALDDADDICFVEGQLTSDLDSILSDITAQFELASADAFSAFCEKKSGQEGLVVCIVDNAHHLSDEVILDLLGILQESPNSRLHFVLFSEPHLLDRLENIDAPDIVLTDFYLEKFTLGEAVDYLNFRMEMADYLGPEIFTEAKVDPWWRQAQGQLLQLHEHAQQTLLASVSSRRTEKQPKFGFPIPYIIGVSVLISGLAVGYLYFGGPSKKDNQQITQPIPISKLPSAAAAPLASSSVASLGEAAVAQVGGATPGIIENTSAIAVETTAKQQQKEQVDDQQKALSAETKKVEAKPSVTLEPTPAVVKQSVVPLVQTNTVQANTGRANLSRLPASSVDAEKKSVKSDLDSVAKETKKSELSSVANKPSLKVKGEDTVTEKPKLLGGFSEQEKTILGWDSSEFTLQIVGLSSEKSAHEFVAAQANKKDLLLFRSTRQGKDWFVVVFGHFASAAKARQAAQLLPDAQKKATPWPREIRVIQGEIKQR